MGPLKSFIRAILEFVLLTENTFHKQVDLCHAIYAFWKSLLKKEYFTQKRKPIE
jgi:hypothetical protein